MSISQQLIEFLNQPPGSLVYQVIVLLALQATIGLSWWQWRRQPGDQFARRLLIASAGILLVRLAVFLTIIFFDDSLEAVSILPPIQRAIDAVMAVLLIWALIPHPQSLPRLGDVIALILIILIGFMYAFFSQEWLILVESSNGTIQYAETQQAAVWDIFQMVILAIGGLLVLVGREEQWSFRLSILVVLLTAHGLNLWNHSELGQVEAEGAYWVRLGNLITFFLLIILAYRHNMYRLLTDENAIDEEFLPIRPINLTRQVIDSIDYDQTLQHSLEIGEELFDSQFTGLALISSENSEHLNVFGNKKSLDLIGSNDDNKRQDWAINRSQWPAISLAMATGEQVELNPNGLGSRQLHNFYEELNLTDLGALLIEPVKQSESVAGVFLLAGPAEKEFWPAGEKALCTAYTNYISTALSHSRQLRAAEVSFDSEMIFDTEKFTKEIHSLEEERDQALAKVKTLTGKLRESEARLKAEDQNALMATTAVALVTEKEENQKLKELEGEVQTLREALLETENNLRLVALGDGGINPDWVMLTISRYSRELQKARETIDRLESDQNSKDFNHEESQIGVDIRQTIESAVNEVGIELSEKHLKLDLHLSEDLPFFYADDNSFFLVVIHLLKNAIQVSDEDGKLILTAQIEELVEEVEIEKGEGLDFLHIKVSDSGGNKSQTLHSLVQETIKHPGNEELQSQLADGGEYLFAAVSLINDLGGRTWVNGSKSKGSTFSALLPLNKNGRTIS